MKNKKPPPPRHASALPFSILPNDAQLSSLRRSSRKSTAADGIPISFHAVENYGHDAENDGKAETEEEDERMDCRSECVAAKKSRSYRQTSRAKKDNKEFDGINSDRSIESSGKETPNDTNSPMKSSCLEEATGIKRQSWTCRADITAATKSTGLTPRSHARFSSRPDSTTHPETNEWIHRRTKAEIASNAKRFRSKPTPTAKANPSDNINVQSDGERVRTSRPSLKFMAAPGMANKRKRQTTLRDLVIKK
ncbi:hypothetical protein ACHAW6_003868 [Cyclotella cf. meneghiniana]